MEDEVDVGQSPVAARIKDGYSKKPAFYGGWGFRYLAARYGPLSPCSWELRVVWLG
jgi:hypothetical protein